MKNKNLQCPHFQGDGYTYDLGEFEINLCASCERELFSQFAKQICVEKDVTIREDN